ncbi:VaFE repeat-containing surface-anchored protein [Enterococcus lactis]|uniref:VaFE repeat-containing surface-anchored protein n=1 Tax=Enterococcus lactis TaxID=357441 RepID=UPI00189425ED
MAPNQVVTIVDEVSYEGLVAGKEYRVEGTLMDKTTGKPLMVDGKEVTANAKFTAKTANGKQNVEFTFNTPGLDDKELVVFENLYFGTKVIATHADINDKGQTVKVDTPNTPNTPLPQTGSEKYQTKGLIGLALAGVSTLLLSVYYIVKRKNRAK